MAWNKNNYKKQKPLTQKDRESVERALHIADQWKRRIKARADFVKGSTIYSETGWYKEEQDILLSAQSMLSCLGPEWELSGTQILFDGRNQPEEDPLY